MSISTVDAEKELLTIRDMLEKEPESADILRTDIKDRIITILREAENLTAAMQTAIYSIIDLSGLRLREICDPLVGIEGEVDDGDYDYDDVDDGDTWEEVIMPIQLIRGPLLPPGTGVEKSAVYFSNRAPSIDGPRLAIFRKILEKLHISEENCLAYKDESGKGHIYEIIAIPELGKIILVCDKAGNATYVVEATLEEAEKYARMTKNQLRRCHNVKFLAYRNRTWEIELYNILIANSPRAYFRAENAKKIGIELRAFAEKIRGGIDVKQLPLWNFGGLTITGTDGKAVSANAYIGRAACELGIVKNPANFPKYEVLSRLLKLAGIK